MSLTIMAFKQEMTLKFYQKSRDVYRCLLGGRVELSHDLGHDFLRIRSLGRQFPDLGTNRASTKVHAGRQIQKDDLFTQVLEEDMSARAIAKAHGSCTKDCF